MIYCHCEQCQRTSGHFVAATACASDHLAMDHSAGLTWFASSDKARRAFCKTCGTSLFWQLDGRDAISIMAGTVDRPNGLVASHHMFAGQAGDYYALTDGLPHDGPEMPGIAGESG